MCKDVQISATSFVAVQVIASTVESASISGVFLPEIPEDNPYSPNRAG